MKATIELHGVLQRLAGTESLQIELPEGATAADALDRIGNSAELAAKLECCACAVGDELVSRSHVLSEGMTLVLIPPVSGG